MSTIPACVSSDTWQSLIRHQRDIAKVSMVRMFKDDPARAKKFSKQFHDLYLDYSKHRINETTLSLLLTLAESADLTGAIQRLYAGEKINRTENRAAMHLALRAPSDQPYWIDGIKITEQVHHALQRMQQFVESLHTGSTKGYSGRPIQTVVNIGIGGSDLGPRMVAQALFAYAVTDISVHFVSNADTDDINQVLQQADPETTLFIIASKSFRTKETLNNAEIAMRWLTEHGCGHLTKHLVAVTSNQAAALKLGIAEENIFHIWDWVSGRYSLWSAIGLPVAVKIGMPHFKGLLRGAHSMDEHFRTQPLENNIPVILALIDLWYINFFHCETLAVFPYSRQLNLLPPHLGQVVMESNGKRVDLKNQTVGYPTAPIIWGGSGSDAQHSYFQLLHQGAHLVPVDFIVGLTASSSQARQYHQRLLANCLAQSAALMKGSTAGEPHKHIPGNKPSTTILYRALTPATLGALLSLYEHRVFVQGQLWHINSFDQWGVELGKTMAEDILAMMNGKTNNHDASTGEMIARYLAAATQTKDGPAC